MVITPIRISHNLRGSNNFSAVVVFYSPFPLSSFFRGEDCERERERESDKVRFMIRRRAEKKVERLILSTKWGKAKEKGDV